MEFRLTPFALAFLLILVWPLPASTQDSDEGTTAYNAGDYATAERIWRGQAAEGNAAAKYNLGILYENGFGVEQDMVEAKSWYTQAAQQDNELAVTAIAEINYEEKNFAEALTWYGKAADRGDTAAQVQIGNMYLSGEGVEADEAQAVAWFERAGGNGHANAQHWLGDWYAERQDNKNALKWYDKAASGGIAEAEPKRDAIYTGLFPPAMGGEDVSPVSIQKKAIDMGLLNLMGQESEIKLTRTYLNAAAGSTLTARISINDAELQMVMGWLNIDPETIQDEREREILEEFQSSDAQAFEYAGYKGLAQYSTDQLKAIALVLNDDLIVEYEFGDGPLAPTGIEVYLLQTNFAGIIETLDGHGFEASFLASERGQQMFNDFSEDIARELEEQDSTSQ